MPWRTVAALSTLAFALACGPQGEGAGFAPPREIAEWCSFQGVRLGVEPGVVADGTTCAQLAAILTEYEQAYEARWAPVPALLNWTVRIVAERFTEGAQPGHFFAGETFWGNQTIDLYQGSLNVVPHEIHHVALGPSSAFHEGWCPFGDWEAREGILDEHTYLGCPAVAN